MKKPDWKPISEAPKDGTPVLVCIADTEYYPDKAWYDARLNQWVIFTHPTTAKRFYITIDPTHFMELPFAPKTTSDEP